jgi:hypothetical protein
MTDNRIFTIRFYRPIAKDWLSNLNAVVGRLFGYNMDLSHVAIEWDGGILGITLHGMELYSKEAEAEYRSPDIILYFETDDDDIKKKYIWANILALSPAVGLKLWSIICFAFNPKSTRLWLCTDFVEFLGFFPHNDIPSLTPVQLLKKYASKSSMMYVTDYGKKVLEREQIPLSHVLPEMWESGQSSI